MGGLMEGKGRVRERADGFEGGVQGGAGWVLL